MPDLRRAMGDWQTPEEFAAACCRLIRDHFNFSPQQIVEPTCGAGNFIAAARRTFPQTQVYGIELNPHYVEDAQQRFAADKSVRFMQGDFLHDDFPALQSANCSVLVLGNPPWVTNATLSTLGVYRQASGLPTTNKNPSHDKHSGTSYYT